MRPLVFALALAVGSPATAQSVFEAAVAEAAASARLPRSWIAAVAQAESGWNPSAVSPAGAMGLMQLMPATWRDVRARLGLGVDPFEPRDNLMAGAAYLREMFDRFGAPGFLAAYNAGPARYEAHLAGRRALPGETRRYLARLAPRLSLGSNPEPAPWTHAPLAPPDLQSRWQDESRGTCRSQAAVGAGDFAGPSASAGPAPGDSLNPFNADAGTCAP